MNVVFHVFDKLRNDGRGIVVLVDRGQTLVNFRRIRVRDGRQAGDEIVSEQKRNYDQPRERIR